MIPDTESPARIRELLDRNLRDIFEEADDGRRRAAVDELWAEDGILYGPSGPVTGHEAIAAFAGALRATHPDFAYTPHGSAQILHNAGRLAWGSGPHPDAPVYTGWDVMIVRGGRIAALYVFLDESSDEYRRATER